MITNAKFNLAVNSKIGYLTKYYVSTRKMTTSEAYTFLMKSYVIRVLKDRKSRLFLESVELIKDALIVEEKKGAEAAKVYLGRNIGG